VAPENGARSKVPDKNMAWDFKERLGAPCGAVLQRQL